MSEKNVLMPKATAVWLIENTCLTFKQIADFCGLHFLEIQTIADTESSNRMIGFDPISSGQLTWEEIRRCEKDQNANVQICKNYIDLRSTKKIKKYTPLSKRGDRPDAIAWMIRNHPSVSDQQICKLLSSTKKTVASIRDRTHWNSSNIKPKNPVILGFCSQEEIDAIVKSSSAVEGEK
jgi:uncharacterized protein